MADLLIAHIEIPSSNLDQTKDFLQKVFGWEFKPFGNGYMLFNNHKGIMVGLRKVEKVNSGDTTVFHINVDNIDNHLKKVKENGGSIFKRKSCNSRHGMVCTFERSAGKYHRALPETLK